MRYYVEYHEYGRKHDTIVSAPNETQARKLVESRGMFVVVWKVKEL